jgi:molybdopterin molybdotransferase
MDHRVARQQILERVAGPRTERTPLHDAAGRVLSADVATPIDHPPFDNAAMDGYAVRSDDLAALPVVLDVIDTAPAGHPSNATVGPGQAVRILTGAALAAGADCVVPVEHTDAGREQVQVHRSVPAGANLRRAGEGARRGDIVLRAGTVLNAGHLGLAASCGLTELDVAAPPRVAIVTTGDELVPAGQPLGPGQIHESNAVTVDALARRCGAATSLHHSPDDPGPLHELLEELAGTHEVVLSTGGVSMGAEYDSVRVALAGAAVEIVQMDIRPAKPLAFGTLGDALFVGLPGNPVSVVVAFELFVRPALRRLAGIEPAVPPTTTGPAGERFAHPGGPATHYLRVQLVDGRWVSTGGGGSHLIAGIAAAGALAVLAPGDEVAPGDALTLVPLWS